MGPRVRIPPLTYVGSHAVRSHVLFASLFAKGFCESLPSHTAKKDINKMEEKKEAQEQKKEQKEKPKLYICEVCGLLSKTEGICPAEGAKFIPKFTPQLLKKQFMMWSINIFFGVGSLAIGFALRKTQPSSSKIMLFVGVLLLLVFVWDFNRRRSLF